MEKLRKTQVQVHKTGLKVRLQTRPVAAKPKHDCSVTAETKPLYKPKTETQKPSWEPWLKMKNLTAGSVWPWEKVKNEKRVIQWASPNNPFRHKRTGKKKRNNPAWQMICSAGAALVIGTIMGLSVLNLFFNENATFSNRTIDSHLNPPPDAGEKETPLPEPTDRSQALPPLQTVMLQAGSYEEKAGAEKAMNQFRVKGLAAVMSEQAPYRIYLGLAPDRDLALKLSAIYQEQDVSVYLKEVRLQGEAALDPEVNQALPDTLKQGNHLVQQLSSLSAGAIRGTAQQETPLKVPGDLSEQFQSFVVQMQSVKGKLPGDAKESADRMIQALDQAVQSGLAAQKNPGQALLWQMQEGLIRYTVGYEKLIQSLKEQ